MRLYLVRHAEAKREEEDPRRGLSEKGLADIRKIRDFLKPKGIRVSKIFHSGKLRALQTAEVLAEAISAKDGIEQTEGLAPLDDPSIWVERLKKEREDLVLVGHLPHLEKLAGALLTGNPEQRVVAFKAGGVVCLERSENGSWAVLWAVVPELL